IMAHGSEELKQAHLSKILSAEEIWCQGFSEPGAGSDLAAARTSAERRGDTYVVNGQKVWSSFAHIADFCILVTRSDPAAPRYRNLTYLTVDMHAPGVEVRPLRQITGEAEFNEIFFTDVEVPVSNRLGDEGDGWQVAMTTLLHERGTLGFALTAALDVGVGRLIETANEHVNGDAGVRERIAAEWIEMQALRYTNYRSLGTYQRTGIPGPEGSAIKLRWSEQNQRLTKLGRALLGAESILDDGWWHYQQLRSRGNTIEAGSSEVLRNIVAERVLGLPDRDRRPDAPASSRRRRRAGNAAATCGDGRRGGRRRAARARARRRVCEDARAVRQEDRRVPGRGAPARRHLRRRRACTLPR